MKIEKEYNIEQLSNILKTRIAEYQVKPSFKTVSLDVLTAQRIVDVLETLASWENKTISGNGAKTNEMKLHNEKDANGNILRSMDCHLEELEDNRNCFGYCVEDDYVCTHCADYEKCRKETNKIKSSEDKAETNRKLERSDCCRINGRVPGCYGCYYEKGLYCPDCKSRESCVELTINREKDIEDKTETNSKPERGETLCDNCLMKSCCKVDCTHEHITEQMLGNLVKCFGKSYRKRPIIVCETCKYAEQCKELTEHE